MKRVAISLVASLGERYVLLAVELASYILLARLLSPEEIGIYAVAAAIIGIAQVVRDFGVGSYLIQEPELTSGRVRTAFTINLIIGATLCLLLLSTANAIASFYGDDQRLAVILAMLSATFLLIPFNSTTIAVLKRELRFDILAAMNLAAGVAGALVAVIMAWLDFGYYSLVYSSLTRTAVILAAGALYRRKEFFLKPRFAEIRRVLGFGSQVAVTNIVAHIAINANDLVVGRVLGFAPVAILSRAQGLINLFHRDVLGSVRGVALPAFADSVHKGENIDRVHLSWMSSVTIIAWPFYGFAALYPTEVLTTLFGPQWHQSAPLVPWFAIAAAVSAPSGFIPTLFVAKGCPRLLMTVDVPLQLFRLCLVVTVAALFQSLLAIAIAYVFLGNLATPLFYWAKEKVSPTNWRQYRNALVQSAVVTLFTLIPAFAVSDSPMLPREGAMHLLSLALISAACWLIATVIVGHAIVPLIYRMVVLPALNRAGSITRKAFAALLRAIYRGIVSKR